MLLLAFGHVYVLLCPWSSFMVLTCSQVLSLSLLCTWVTVTEWEMNVLVVLRMLDECVLSYTDFFKCCLTTCHTHTHTNRNTLICWLIRWYLRLQMTLNYATRNKKIQNTIKCKLVTFTNTSWIRKIYLNSKTYWIMFGWDWISCSVLSLIYLNVLTHRHTGMSLWLGSAVGLKKAVRLEKDVTNRKECALTCSFMSCLKHDMFGAHTYMNITHEYSTHVFLLSWNVYELCCREVTSLLLMSSVHHNCRGWETAGS